MSQPLRIGAYSIIRQIGSGATSDVYLAMRDDSYSTVALKQFRNVFHSEWHRDMFLSEVEFGQKMHHKNIVHVLEADMNEKSGAYLVMDYVNGASLDQYEYADNLLPIKTVVSIIEQISGALSYAAELGIVHRDVKPANIILSKNGTAKLTDFGCAVPRNVIGTLIAGSLAYMSPEQLEGEALDQRADIYSLGAVLYRLLTGKNTFEAENNFDARIAILNFPIIPIQTYRKELPGALIAVIKRAMQKNVQERYANWDEFRREFGTAAHEIRMSELDLDMYRGFSMSTQSVLSGYAATDRQFSRSGFSRSTMPETFGA